MQHSLYSPSSSERRLQIVGGRMIKDTASRVLPSVKDSFINASLTTSALRAISKHSSYAQSS